jgi:hypothetical protein
MKIFNKMRIRSSLLSVLLIFRMVTPITTMAVAEDTVNLGTTSGFAVLAGSTITNTGNTTIDGSDGGNVGGEVGLSPGTAFTGQASVTTHDGIAINDADVHIADAVAVKAKVDLKAAYNDADSREVTGQIPSELGGTTLTPGVYDSEDGTFQITGTLTLDAEGDPNAVFIFKTASTLIAQVDSKVELKNEARFCRTFWKVGSSATLKTDSYFVGHIFAMESITANYGATVQGQLLARDGAVTLNNNTITNGICEEVEGQATLTVIKNVINDNGSTSVASDFMLHIKTLDNDVVASPKAGAEFPGNTYTLVPGEYVVSEENFDGYTQSFSVDGHSTINGAITLEPGENKTITITNDDISATAPPVQEKATLHVIKHITNDDGGTAVATNFNLNVKSLGSDDYSSSAPGNETGTTYTLDAGTYIVSEDAFTGYTASFSGDSSNGNITLAPGDNKTVMITSNDISITPPVIAPAIPIATPHVTPQVTPTGVTTTISGGELPNTSTHLYEVLIGGIILTIVGVLGWLSRKRYE